MCRCVRLASLVLAWVVIVPSLADAQASIGGVVKDTSGAVLPGVSVEAASPALIEKVRTTVTDGTGQYKLEDLRPGEYVVAFTLPGFATVKRGGIELAGTATASVNAELRVGAVEETITVTGQATTVDVQNTVRQRVLDREVLEVLPASRAPAQLAALTPNVTASTQDVGGVTGDGSSRGGISARGVGDSRLLIAGLVTQTGSGTSHGVYNVEAYQEVLVDTGAVSAETYSGGVRINFIPRDGGNRFSGSFVTSFANNSMAGNNFTQDLKDRGLPTPNTIKELLDVNPGFGGPIQRDKLWFHVAARYDRAYNYASVYFNKNAGNPDLWTYEPDQSRAAADTENTIQNFNARVTWQASPRNKFAVGYDTSKVCDCTRTLSATTSPEATLDIYNINPRHFYTAEWAAPVSNRLLLEANLVRIYSDAARARVNPYFPPSSVPLIQVTEQSTGLKYRGTASAPESINYPVSLRAVASYATGAHAFKVGFNFGTVGQSRETFSPDAPLAYRFNNGVPNQITEFATPFTAIVDGIESGLFVQDRWTVARFSLSGGVRYDHVSDSFPGQTIGPGNFVPNRHIVFARSDGVSWNDIEPRAGLVMDIFGNGKTAVKVSLNKYLTGDVSGGAFGIGMAPANNMVTSTTRAWNDADRNFVPECNLASPLANGECQAMTNQDFGNALSVATYDPSFIKGWNKRPNNWQFSAGVQHQILPRVSVGLEYWRTWFGNFVVVDSRGYHQSDFDQFSITAPRDPRLPVGGGYAISGLYDVKPSVFGRPANGYVTLADNYGKQIEHWNGVDFTFNVRPRPGVLLQGGTTTQRQTTDSCDIVALVAPMPPPDRGGALPAYNPSNLFCHIQGTFLTQLKILGSFRVPRVDLQLSASLQNLPGPEIDATYTASNADVIPSLGRNLAGGAKNVSVTLVEPRSMYGARINQLDLRISKILRFGTTRASVGLDFYNALNSNAVLSSNSVFASWQQPLAILNARFIKAVFQLNF